MTVGEFIVLYPDHPATAMWKRIFEEIRQKESSKNASK